MKNIELTGKKRKRKKTAVKCLFYFCSLENSEKRKSQKLRRTFFTVKIMIREKKKGRIFSCEGIKEKQYQIHKSHLHPKAFPPEKMVCRQLPAMMVIIILQ